MLLRPQLDGPEGDSEGLLVGHLIEDFVCDATTVEGANAFLVQVLQQHRVVQLHVTWHLK